MHVYRHNGLLLFFHMSKRSDQQRRRVGDQQSNKQLHTRSQPAVYDRLRQRQLRQKRYFVRRRVLLDRLVVFLLLILNRKSTVRHQAEHCTESRVARLLASTSWRVSVIMSLSRLPSSSRRSNRLSLEVTFFEWRLRCRHRRRSHPHCPLHHHHHHRQTSWATVWTANSATLAFTSFSSRRRGNRKRWRWRQLSPCRLSPPTTRS